MKAKKKSRSSDAPSHRSKAEKSPSKHPERTPKLSPGDAEKLINELEAQNQELREKQREVEEARRRYLDLYDLAPIGYFVLNQKGTIMESNLPGARMLGLPRNQIIGTPFVLFVAREFTHPFYEHLKKVFSSNTKQACELKMSQKYQNSVKYVSMESIALETDKSATCRSAVIDITERKSAEKELIQTREELLERNTQLRRLSAGLLDTQEEERSRVAVDVHDSFASLLCAIKDELRPFLGKGEDDRLNQVFYQLDIAIRDAMRIQSGLRPPALDDLGLFPALKMLCREFQNSHSHIHVEKRFLLGEDGVPDSIEVPIFRITQEAFDNIAAHSGADSVTIAVARRHSLIELVIRDNGKGFNVEESFDGGKGRGLSVMRERADLSGGLFDIESEPGKGTTLRVSWPFA
jgi:PAS domain S-box-containing protein